MTMPAMTMPAMTFGVTYADAHLSVRLYKTD